MKRIITEIFIEVEETLAIRQITRNAEVENELRLLNKPIVRPKCGRTIPENKNLSAGMSENDEQIRLSKQENLLKTKFTKEK